jgi:formylglycine-generating enzyme required for sulfatase activity
MCQPDGGTQWATWTPASGANENLPINCVTFYDAYAFCIWDGQGFLPSSAEWDFAAAGGAEQQLYAWGSTPIPGPNTELAVYNCYWDNASLVPTCGVGQMAPVGSAPEGQGRWGQFDLTGNVYEFVLDSETPTYLTPCTDCANAPVSDPETDLRYVRGGSFASSLGQLPVSVTLYTEAAHHQVDVGIRCARSP